MIWKKMSSDQNMEMVSLLGSSASFIGGNLKLCHDVRIDGEVEADLEVEGKAIISTSGSVNGRIRATNLIVAGRIEGDIEVHECLVLKSSAYIKGTIRAAFLVTEEGASGEMRVVIGNFGASGKKSTVHTATPGSEGETPGTDAELVVVGSASSPGTQLEPVWRSGVRIVPREAEERVIPEDDVEASKERFW